METKTLFHQSLETLNLSLGGKNTHWIVEKQNGAGNI